MKREFDFIIIGGGISGLSMGALLSKRGYKVLLCEKNKKTGGRYKSIQRDGFVLEMGFKANRFGNGGYVKELFDLLGENIEFIHSGKILCFENEVFSVLPRGLAPVLLCKELSIKEKLSFLGLYKKIMTLSPNDYYDVTLWSWLAPQINSNKIMSLLSYYSQLGLVSPNIKETSMGEFIFLAKKGMKTKYSFGIPKGGWPSKLNLFTDIIMQKGDIITDLPVHKIKLKGKTCTGIETKEGDFFAKYVITAFPLQTGLFKLIPEDFFSSDFVKNVQNLKPTCGINLDFCLDKVISKENRLIATRDPYPNAQGILVSNLNLDFTKTYGSWLSILPPEKIAKKETIEEEKKKMENLINTMFPNVWEHCTFKRFMVLKRINSASPLLGQTNSKRPDFVAPNIKNLFFIGDSTRGVGGGGDVAISSVIMAYEKILTLLKK